MNAKQALSALGAGAIFGVGLCLSGMTDPKNVLAFLDVTGRWSPKLAGVMFGAIAVHAAWLRFAARKTARAPHSLAPSNTSAPARVDAALVLGAAIFGVGWGLSGYCPGPSIVALGAGAGGAIVFVAAMVLGMRLCDALRGLTKTTAKQSSPREPHAAE
jgi:uncharacterized membrane protein YedE/YeeE